MEKVKKLIVHYVKESLESLLTDQLVSILFGVLVTWIFENKFDLVDNPNIPIYLKFLILGILFFIVYVISILTKLHPHRFKFHLKSIDILVEYLGDTVEVFDTYTVKPNRFRVKSMYTRRTWYSDEKFNLEVITDGYNIKQYNKLGNENEFYIIFPHFQYWWQTRSFKTHFTGKNKKRQFQNFYWYYVICPVDKMSIEVRMPQKYCAGEARLVTFYDHEGTNGSKKEVIEYNGSYKWEIDSPKLGWSYKFEWTWSENESKKIHHY